MHTYKAASLFRSGLLLGSRLCKMEAMVNVTKPDIIKIEKPDWMLKEKLPPSTGNAVNASDTLNSEYSL